MAINSHEKLNFCSSELFGGLENNIFLKIGCKVSLTENIDVMFGLVNGALGILRGVLFCSDGKISKLLIEFDQYNGPEYFKDNKKLFPLERSEKNHDFDFKYHRIQFPVCLAYSMTIHKSQGQTIRNVYLDIENKEFSLGLTYVRLSRVKDIDCLKLAGFSFDRLMQLRKGDSFLRKEKEWERLMNLCK